MNLLLLGHPECLVNLGVVLNGLQLLKNVFHFLVSFGYCRGDAQLHGAFVAGSRFLVLAHPGEGFGLHVPYARVVGVNLCYLAQCLDGFLVPLQLQEDFTLQEPVLDVIWVGLYFLI